MTTKISVIVPCYNQGNFLSETLDSLISQTLQEWECIIVDDGSTDNSSEIIQSYVHKDERIRSVWQENAGPSAARNKGVSLTSAPLIFFLDGDNLIHRELLRRGVDYMETHAKVKLYYTGAEFFGSRQGEFMLNYTSYKDLLMRNCIDCACIVRRDDFERVGGFDEALKGFEDWEFFIRYLQNDDTLYKDPKILFRYRCSDNPTRITTHANLYFEDKTMYIYHKHREKYIKYFGTIFRSPFYVMREYSRLSKKLEGILHSKTYRLGKAILFPFQAIKRLVHR